MNRKDARALVKATIEGLGTFQLVKCGRVGSFGGKQIHVAIITSRNQQLTRVARGLYTVTNGIFIGIYVARTDEETTEDLIDDLSLSVALALHETDVFDVGTSDADGANRRIDGQIYRVERIPLIVLDEGSDD